MSMRMNAADPGPPFGRIPDPLTRKAPWNRSRHLRQIAGDAAPTNQEALTCGDGVNPAIPPVAVTAWTARNRRSAV
jgi:hypothetical protein